MSQKLKKIALDFCNEIEVFVKKADFGEKVKFVYNPLEYAQKPYFQYLEKFCGKIPKKNLFLGMNPGPFGMAQTGVPFGEVNLVKTWLNICEKVNQPKKFHPKRPILGYDCKRSEVSGRRLWSFFAEKFKNSYDFFNENIVLNYCPLLFVSESGANITPNKLPQTARIELEKLCDNQLVKSIKVLGVKNLIGVGAYAEEKFLQILKKDKSSQKKQIFLVGKILHPSPASPKANKGWSKFAQAEINQLNIWH